MARSLHGNVRPLAKSTTANPPDDLDAALQAAARIALRRGMRRMGWTVEVLAQRCATDYKTAWRWLSGESRVPGKALVAVGAVANDVEAA